jgi:hypothetical protein
VQEWMMMRNVKVSDVMNCSVHGSGDYSGDAFAQDALAKKQIFRCFTMRFSICLL